MKVAFTLCSNNYLAQAISLGNSLIKYNTDYKFIVGLVDKRSTKIDYKKIPFEIVEVDDIAITAFTEMFNRYSITELNTAVKPYYFQHLFNSYKSADRVIYLDPDILVYQPFTDLEEVLEENEIVITPHFTTPIDDDKILAETDILNSGLYNLGFIALKRGEESYKLIEWWAKRLESKAYIDFAKGMFTDQIWINFVPLFFNKVLIYLHPGYNMAYWNLHERSLVDNKMVLMNNTTYPLVFFHFSGFSPDRPEILSKYQNRYTLNQRTDIKCLFTEYNEILRRNGYLNYFQIPCHYKILKEEAYIRELKEKISQIPFYKRILRKLIIKTVSSLGIVLDYTKL